MKRNESQRIQIWQQDTRVTNRTERRKRRGKRKSIRERVIQRITNLSCFTSLHVKQTHLIQAQGPVANAFIMSYHIDSISSSTGNGGDVDHHQQYRRPYQSEALTTKIDDATPSAKETADENFSIASYLIQQIFGVCAADFQSKAMMPSTLKDIHDEILSIDYDADDGIVVRGGPHYHTNESSSVHDYSFYNHYNYNHEGVSNEYYDEDFDDDNTLLANCTKHYNKHSYSDFDDLDSSIVSRTHQDYYYHAAPNPRLHEVSQEESKEEDSDDESLLADDDDSVPDYQFDSNRLTTPRHRHHDRSRSLLLSKTSSSNVETKDATPIMKNLGEKASTTATESTNNTNKVHVVDHNEAPVTPTRPVSTDSVEDAQQTRCLSSRGMSSSVRLASE